ncbi:MAG TPA: hypothetical protein PK364_01910 [Synergistaceae bacterium]|nr:hypothetical protein [Synergistaceae bacterium]HPJ25025.1 hypothetical protein [Synergistaceae bacterium]
MVALKEKKGYTLVQFFGRSDFYGSSFSLVSPKRFMLKEDKEKIMYHGKMQTFCH